MHTTQTIPGATGTRLRAEGLIDLAQAALTFPADNHAGHVSTQTILRWIISGKHGHRLEGCRVRGKWMTSVSALQRFKQATGL